MAGAKGAGAVSTEDKAGVWAPRGVIQALHGDQVQGPHPALELSGGLGQGEVPATAGGSCFRLSHPQNLEQPYLVPRNGCVPSLCPH